jgi:hypothetical protein
MKQARADRDRKRAFARAPLHPVLGDVYEWRSALIRGGFESFGLPLMERS